MFEKQLLSKIFQIESNTRVVLASLKIFDLILNIDLIFLIYKDDLFRKCRAPVACETFTHPKEVGSACIAYQRDIL